MEKKNILLLVILTLIGFIVHSQKLEQDQVEKFAQDLNEHIAPNFQIKLKEHNAFCSINKLTKTLDLRSNYEIGQDSSSKGILGKSHNDNGRYIGPIFWKYKFEGVSNSNALFKATKFQQVFFTLKFKEQDTITIKSKLNAYTSHHRTLDSDLHDVQWTGDKYISLLLTPKLIDNYIKIEVRGITVSGKFQRKDQKVMAKNYTKTLREIIRREFENLFKSEDMKILFTKALKQ